MKKPSHQNLRHLINQGMTWNCKYCGNSVSCICEMCVPVQADRIKMYRNKPKHVATVDHIVPRMLGGTWAFKNLTIACARCNNLKGHLLIEGPITLEKIHEARRAVKASRVDTPGPMG